MNENALRLIKSTTQDIRSRKKAGRPSKRSEEKKRFRRFSVSVDEEQYKQIQEYANDKYEGNISLLFRKLFENKIKEDNENS